MKLKLETPSLTSVDGTITWEGGRIPVTVGLRGMCPAYEKREGDMKTPIGTYAFTSLFGYAKEPLSTHLPYIAIDDELQCVDDPTSKYYNQFVRGEGDWKNAERMLRKDHLYRHGFVLSYNSEGAADLGSCIFMHIWRGPGKGTEGCIAMAEEHLIRLIRAGAIELELSCAEVK